MARKSKAKIAEEEKGFIIVNKANFEKIYFSGNAFLQELLGMKERTFYRYREQGRFGVNIIDNNYKLKDVLEFIVTMKSIDKNKKELEKQPEYWKAQELKLKVFERHRTTVPLSYAQYVTGNVAVLFYNLVVDVINRSEYVQEENKQLILDELDLSLKQAKNLGVTIYKQHLEKDQVLSDEESD